MQCCKDSAKSCMSTAVHMTSGSFVREQCPFVVYSTYLMPKQNSKPTSAVLVLHVCCIAHCCLPQGNILVNSCNCGDKCNCQNNKCFFCSDIVVPSHLLQSWQFSEKMPCGKVLPANSSLSERFLSSHTNISTDLHSLIDSSVMSFLMLVSNSVFLCEVRGGSRRGSLGSNEPPFLLIHSTYWFFVTPSNVRHSALACQSSLATV